eukprot:TRINITY_DN2264_c0_g3_i1.p1 TRINITY_DN2264_c0_g3~~TRINITY_DN2264_c0_g3_i1.p1  ORF type:complete len:256 (-),score=42.14 TRINITY_DN2264_c0_g3_i1:11-754(-)
MKDPRIDLDLGLKYGEKKLEPKISILFSSYGLLSVVEEILKDPIVTTEDIDECLERAATNGYFAIVKKFFEDPRYQPNPRTLFRVIEASCRKGNLEVFEHSIQLYESVVGVAQNAIFRPIEVDTVLYLARLGQNTEIIWKLLQMGNCMEEYLPKLVKKQFMDIVKRMLQDESIDPCVNDNQALKNAALIPNLEIVDLLLQHPRMDPSTVQFDRNLQPIVLKRLLKDPRISIENTKRRQPERKKQRRE